MSQGLLCEHCRCAEMEIYLLLQEEPGHKGRAAHRKLSYSQQFHVTSSGCCLITEQFTCSVRKAGNRSQAGRKAEMLTAPSARPWASKALKCVGVWQHEMSSGCYGVFADSEVKVWGEGSETNINSQFPQPHRSLTNSRVFIPNQISHCCR